VEDEREDRDGTNFLRLCPRAASSDLSRCANSVAPRARLCYARRTRMNHLYYGDRRSRFFSLHVLRDSLAAESVDLIYLDPPFNSKRDYNLLFKSPKGHASEAQIEAFEDTWHWNAQAEAELSTLTEQSNTDVTQMMNALVSFLGRNDMTAYLVMMATRLLELHRVLKPTGSLYLHCDPTASHYLKVVLDGVFGKENFKNEIIWQRTGAHGDAKQGAKQFGRIHDVILFYTKSEEWTWNSHYLPLDQSYVESHYRHVEEGTGRHFRKDNLTAARPGGDTSYEWHGVKPYQGRFWAYSRAKMEEFERQERLIYTKSGMPELKRYLDESPGVSIQDLWTDIAPINSQAQERLGYATQKPVALLERILSGSTNPGGVVLDPFCGCGTAVHAAQKLGRQWIGIDITCLAIALIEKRLKDAFGARCKFEVHGTPKDLESARDLAARDKYQFQWWAVSLVEAQPFQGKKKGADTGIDGLKFFRDLDKKEARKIIVSVKGGENVGPTMVKDLIATVARDKAEIGLFLTLTEPTKAMRSEAVAAGFYESPNGKKYPRLQLLTIADLLAGTARAEHPDYEPDLNFKKAKTEAHGEQAELL
jgi:adenine specific DNA methylase Mod